MRHSTPLKLLASLLSVAWLSGCAFAPGSHFDADVESAPVDDLVDVEPITLGLIASQERAPDDQALKQMSEAQRAALDSYDYRIGKGDVLSITVYDHPELTIPAGAERSAAEAGNQVRNDGTIFYPYAGRIEVVGKTLDQTRALLTRRLSEYIADPQVDVSVADFRSKKIYVSGAVSQPGTFPITSVPMTVADAISQAGGASADANWHNVILTHDGVEQHLSLYAVMREGDQSQNRLLRDGDILHVPTAENRNVSVMGQVLSPGTLSLGNEPLSLTDAVAQAGGINETSAEASGIFVVRGQPLGSDKLATVYQLDVSNAAAFSLGNRFTLKPQDVVYVTTAPIARWNRVISLLLPSVQLPGTVSETATDVRDVNE